MPGHTFLGKLQIYKSHHLKKYSFAFSKMILIVHRDLGPGNILVDEQGEPKVIDYGVARASEVKIDQQTMHTEAGRLVGTVQYMAPEQVDMAMQDIEECMLSPSTYRGMVVMCSFR